MQSGEKQPRQRKDEQRLCEYNNSRDMLITFCQEKNPLMIVGGYP